jgi:protein TonB
VHLSTPLILTGGSSRHAASPQTARSLSARIITEPAAPVPPRVQEKPARIDEAPQRAERAAASERTPAPRAERPVTVASQPEAAGALPNAPDLTYYPAKQLDVYPRLLAPLDLKYRGKAAADGVSGRVRLLLLIDETGVVRDASVVEAEPPQYFEEDASHALIGAPFAPAYRNGRAVRSRVLIEVNYGVERGSP